jgi:adenylosuccinate synthase
MARQAARLNSLTELAITKLDILDVLPTIRVCVAYDIGGKRVEYLPADQRMIEHAIPVYEELPGWQQDLREVRHYEDLPVNARRYLEFLAEVAGTPIGFVGVGPERDQVIRIAGSR